MQWHHWFEKSLEDESFYLVAQPVLDRTKEIIQQEIFIRVKDSAGKVIPAGIFMPMATTLGFSLDIDKQVFELLKALTKVNSYSYPLALNLSVDFFSHQDALNEFSKLLDYYKHSNHRIDIEASHLALRQYPKAFAEIADMIKQAKLNFGIDHLDLSYNLDDLQVIKPSYIKVNAGLLDDMHSKNLSAAYQALRSLTHTFDTQLIAVGVDRQSLYERLLELDIDAVQGNLLGEPKEIM